MKRHFLSGAITTALVASLTFSAIAISGRMTIEVDPINVQVNGEVFAPTDVNGTAVPVFAYNGTTYAPLRALAEAYGLEVGYDAASNMATVSDPEAPSAPAPDTASVGDSGWSAEDDAIYRELTENWEFTLMGKGPILGVGEADRAAYLAKPKSEDILFDWGNFEKSDSFRKISTKVADTVNTTGLPYTTITYSGGYILSVCGENISVIH